MANTMRWRYGETNPVMVPVADATEIEIGDLVFLDTTEAKPASALPDQGSELSNQNLLHDAFLGVAMQCSRSGESDPIRVATTGVFEFDCPLSGYEVGDLLGAAEDATGAAIEDQVVTTAPSAAAAIGRSVAQVNPAASRVLVDLTSTVMRGGVQAAA